MKTIQDNIPSPKLHYSFHQPIGQILFFDIETTGLSPRASSIYLIGVLYYDKSMQSWQLRQWFADDYHSEPQILKTFLEFLEPFSALYHFNGNTFDIPYVLSKCRQYKLPVPEYAEGLFQNTVGHQAKADISAASGRISVDILKEIRPLKKKLNLDKASQTALEQWLGIHREDTCSGGDLIKVYTEYMQNRILHPERAAEQERLLLLHNHDDIAGMPEVCSMFSYLDAFVYQISCSAPLEHEVTDGLLQITYFLSVPVPRAVTLQHLFPHKEDQPPLPPASLHLESGSGILTLPMYRGALKYFFGPPKDYFYLPLEDTAIHKSVAQFVEPAYRRKATAATCFTRADGSFFPALAAKHAAPQTSLFFTGYREQPAFYRFPENTASEEATELLHSYLASELSSF